LIDFQNGCFSGGVMPHEDMEAAVANAARLSSCLRDRRGSVLHIRHIAASGAAPFFRRGTSGSKINDAVGPKSDETVFEKSRPNRFMGLASKPRSGKVGLSI